MEGLLGLLLWAGLFYFMMRFGCGAHMVHGHGGHGEHGGDREKTEGAHAGHAQHGATMSTAVDPVCGMGVGPDKGYVKMHEGRQYRFCSRACLDKFEANPGQYAHAA